MNPSKSNHADVWEHYTCLHNVEIIHTEKLFKSFLYFFLNILSMWNKKKKKKCFTAILPHGILSSVRKKEKNKQSQESVTAQDDKGCFYI